MRSERYLSTLLEIMYAISKSEDRLILQADYRRLAGIYKDRIEEELFNREVIYTRSPRPLRSNSDFKLLGYIDDIENEREELRRRESDRKLANSGIKAAKWCGILGVGISCASFLLGVKSEGEISRLEHRVVTLEKTVADLESPVLLDSIYLPAQLDDSLPQTVNLRFKIIDPQTLGTVRTNQLPIPSADSQDHDNRR